MPISANTGIEGSKGTVVAGSASGSPGVSSWALADIQRQMLNRLRNTSSLINSFGLIL